MEVERTVQLEADTSHEHWVDEVCAVRQSRQRVKQTTRQQGVDVTWTTMSQVKYLSAYVFKIINHSVTSFKLQNNGPLIKFIYIEFHDEFTGEYFHKFTFSGLEN